LPKAEYLSAAFGEPAVNPDYKNSAANALLALFYVDALVEKLIAKGVLTEDDVKAMDRDIADLIKDDNSAAAKGARVLLSKL